MQTAAATLAPNGMINNANDLVAKLVSIGNVAIYLLVSLAVLYIVWSVVIYMIKGDDPAKKKESLQHIGYGILGLAIIVSLWGIVNIVVNTFRTNADMPNNLPNADFINSKNNSGAPTI